MSDIDLVQILTDYVPGSYPQPWSWAEEEDEILRRECLCCGKPGHYQHELEIYVSSNGLPTGGVCLSPDGIVWDGHHRIVAARRLGIHTLQLESRESSIDRWVKDHGFIDWVDRKKGDRLSWEQEWRKTHIRRDDAHFLLPAQGVSQPDRTEGGETDVV